MVTDRQMDGRTDRPTLLSIELLSQLKSSLTPVFYQLPIINNHGDPGLNQICEHEPQMIIYFLLVLNI